jgi:1,5-anhydro-D-fructose reductase (1,5-anhydro-D-mannitol-forming)
MVLRRPSACIGWALLGTGAVAQSRMAPAIARHPGSRIVAVISASARRATEFASTTGATRAYTALDAALDDDAVDAVYVSTTNDLHAEQAIACLRAGKHVLCEKPLALSLEDAEAMVAAASEAGSTLAVNHHLRAAESLMRMRSLLATGTIGTPRLIRTLHRCFVRPGRREGWRMTDASRGAGVILDLTVHTADAMRFLTGREVASVCGHAGPAQLGHAGIEGAVAGTMRMDGDILASFGDLYSALPARSEIEIHGDEGRLGARGVLDGSPRAAIVVQRDRESEHVVELRDDPYRRTVERFADAVVGHGRPAATGDDGLRSLAVALALRAAVAEGRSIDVAGCTRAALS